jgi:TonB family protein
MVGTTIGIPGLSRFEKSDLNSCKSGMFRLSTDAGMHGSSLKGYLAVFCIVGCSAMFAQSQKVVPAKLIHMVTPKYPRSAIPEGIDASVTVTLTIPPDGIPKDVRIAKGFRPDFDESAIDAVRQWRFKPATKDGNPVEVTVTVDVAFKAPRNR